MPTAGSSTWFEFPFVDHPAEHVLDLLDAVLGTGQPQVVSAGPLGQFDGCMAAAKAGNAVIGS